ncbi:hypothetical protein HDZ31DRAFT_33020 [Schizophyllum fasciatum]
MHSSGLDATLSRSQEYYMESGDLVVQAGETIYRLHSFHLRRATSFFDDFFASTVWDTQSQVGASDGSPLIIEDVRSNDFDGLMWFFYKSLYGWSSLIDASHVPLWESILFCAEKLQMHQVCKVASHALNRANALDDIRKISLCSKHRLGNPWAFEAISRVISRLDALSEGDIQTLGVDVAVAINTAREKLLRMPKVHPNCKKACCGACTRKVKCFRGFHICFQDSSCREYLAPQNCPKEPRTPLSRVPTVASSVHLARDRLNVPHVIFLQVESQLFGIHKYHLCMASPVFASMFSLPGEHRSQQGSSMDAPVQLQGIQASHFQGLLYFFYDSAYEWLPDVNRESASLWESILHSADQFDMEDVKDVALYALGRPGSLSDARKLALCKRYHVDDEWAQQAYDRLCARKEPLTDEEIEELPKKTIGVIVRAREARLQGDSDSGTLKIALLVVGHS